MHVYGRAQLKHHFVGIAMSPTNMRVSTVFLGGTRPPEQLRRFAPFLPFETMVFDDSEGAAEHIVAQHRYATWATAEEGHKAFCRIFNAEPVDLQPYREAVEQWIASAEAAEKDGRD